VKTLHPGVHGGILAIRSNAAHMDAIKQHNIQPIDLVRAAGLERGRWCAGHAQAVHR
jgi:AICAR transformylase/IMP cyclohydrolase PurH